jgi:hypothetical protein
MTAAKPPERVTLYLDDYGHVWTEDEGGLQGVDPAFDYVRADVVEKRERALRSALKRVACAARMRFLTFGQVGAIAEAALSAADEGEA